MDVNNILFSDFVIQNAENDDSEFEFRVDDDNVETTINNLNSPLKIKLFPKSLQNSFMSNNSGHHFVDYNEPQQKKMEESLNNITLVRKASANLYRDNFKKQTPQFKFTFHQDDSLLGALREKPGDQYLQLDVEQQDNINEDDVDINKDNNNNNIFSWMNQSSNRNIKKHPLEQVSCIFKVFDDVRQDQLALQIITLFQGIFQKANLELCVFPYKTISNRTGSNLDIGGIIECVKNAISRDQLGKTNQCSLYQYFINKFGQEDSSNFQIARENFIKSQAAYSVISYILQIKDRHNGNILINDKGHLIHIDFGFIFDISPANNLRFESANFKLTHEMIQIMGGSKDSEAFQYYVNLTIKGFLSTRNYFEHIYNTIRLMLASSLPCFLKNSMKNLVSRFVLEKNDIEAAKYMRGVIYDAYDKFTTRWYDDIQYLQNRIYR